eukprot:scaffold6538_cov113-Skeletonema_dohrnii-CCMP3373.AAC.4
MGAKSSVNTWQREEAMSCCLCIHKSYDSCIHGRIVDVATDESGGATGKANLQTRKVPLYLHVPPVLEKGN